MTVSDCEVYLPTLNYFCCHCRNLDFLGLPHTMALKGASLPWKNLFDTSSRLNFGIIGFDSHRGLW